MKTKHLLFAIFTFFVSLSAFASFSYEETLGGIIWSSHNGRDNWNVYTYSERVGTAEEASNFNVTYGLIKTSLYKSGLSKGYTMEQILDNSNLVERVDYWVLDENQNVKLNDLSDSLLLWAHVEDTATDESTVFMVPYPYTHIMNKYYNISANMPYYSNSSIILADGNVATEIAFGEPLPAPVVTLLIALGFGAILVYRRKLVKA